MIGVQVADRDGVNTVEIQGLGETSVKRGLTMYFPNWMRAIDQEPIVVDAQYQARSEIVGGESLAYTQRYQRYFTHGDSRWVEDGISRARSHITLDHKRQDLPAVSYR